MMFAYMGLFSVLLSFEWCAIHLGFGNVGCCIC
jgi:hypothetical protein